MQELEDDLVGIDGTTHEWENRHGADYDPVKQNVLRENDAFQLPFG